MRNVGWNGLRILHDETHTHTHKHAVKGMDAWHLVSQ